MKKFTKFLALILSVACAGTMAVSLTACGDKNPDEGKTDTTIPGTDNPGTDNPGTDTPGTDTPGTDNPGTDTPGTETPDDNKGWGSATPEDAKSDKPYEYILEAELTCLDNVGGPGWSGSMKGAQCIRSDVSNASGGYYVGYTYEMGNCLEFEFTSTVAEKADLVIRISSVIPEMYLDSKLWEVKVNGTAVNYRSVVLTGTGGVNQPAEFEDAIVIKDIDLKAEDNIITLTTINDEAPEVTGTTINGTAPEVDCIKIYTTNAKLEWEPYEDNFVGL